MPSKYGFESGSLPLVKNVAVNSAEFDGEWVGNALQSGLIVVAPEFSHEAQSASIRPTVNIAGAEFEYASLSTSFSSGSPPNAPEFDYEVRSVAITPFFNIGVPSAEFDREIQHVIAAMGGIDVHSYENHYEIMGNIGSYLDVRSGEFDYELRPMFLYEMAPAGAEFDYEALGGQRLTAVHVVSPGSSEYGFDALSLQLAASDFDVAYEANSVAIEQFSNATTITPYEYSGEWSSADLTQLHIVAPQGAEFGGEFQSGSFPGVPEIEGGEFGWEMPSPTFRYFLRRPKTPTHRKVQVRV